MKKLLVRLLVLAVVAGAVAAGYYFVQQLPDQNEGDVALLEVQRGDLTVVTHFRGELRAVRSLTLTAPNLGSQSQVISLAPGGSLARRGDLIIRLDDSERVAALEDDLLGVEKIEEQLRQAETELEIRKSQDEVELVRANFQVRRWELEVRRNELISAIDARKNQLSLEEAQARKAKLEEDIKNRLAQREAELAVLREQLKKAELDVDRERKRIEQASVLAPISGLVTILENRSGGRGGFGTSTPSIREGDQIPPGMSVAQLLDLSEMELIAKVEEVERANLKEGQEALIRLDALPGKVVKGSIKRLGTTATMNVFAGEATKKFDCIIAIDMRELLGHVGASSSQIERILATARQNAAQGYGAAPAARAGGGGGGGPAAAEGGNPARQGRRARQGGGGVEGAGAGGAEGAGAGGGRQGGPAGEGGARARGAGGGGRQMSPEMQKRLQELTGGREITELSQEERQKIFQQMRAQGGGAPGGARGGGPGGRGGGPGGGAEAPAAGAVAAGPSAFSLEERANAQLPRPPEEGSDVDILLRPGLLADAEVTVESIPDVVYVPYQAVFESPRGPIVYVWDGKALQPTPVELGQRAESQIVITSGLSGGEQIALQSPDGQRSDTPRKSVSKKKKSAAGGGGGGGLPGGGGLGGGGGRGQ